MFNNGQEGAEDRTSSEYQEISSRDIHFRVFSPRDEQQDKDNQGTNQRLVDDQAQDLSRNRQQHSTPQLASNVDQDFGRGDGAGGSYHGDVRPRTYQSSGFGSAGPSMQPIHNLQGPPDLRPGRVERNEPCRPREVQPVGVGRPIARPDRFDGSDSLTFYLQHFELCAMLNGWTDREKARFLAISLTGPARHVLSGLNPAHLNDYNQLVTALQARFDPVGRHELHRVELRNRQRRANETLSELADDIRIMVERVYPDLVIAARDRMAKDHFIDALNDSEMRTRVLQMRTATLEEALAAAVELEALQRAEKERFGSGKRIRELKVESTSTKGLEEMVKEMAEQMRQMQMVLRKEPSARNKSQSYTSQGGRPQGQGRRCYFCQEEGHLIKDCPKRQGNH